MKTLLKYYLFCLFSFFLAFLVNAADVASDNDYENMSTAQNAPEFEGSEDATPPLDLKEIAYEVLNEVLKFRLRTTNSIAAPAQDFELLDRLDNENTFPIDEDESGYLFASMDGIYDWAKASIEYGIGNCDEYTMITAVLLKKYENLYPDQIKVHIRKGLNFAHIFAVIHRPFDPVCSDWLAVDPWFRKVIPLHEMPGYLAEALVKVPEGENYKFKKVEILGEYDPQLHDLGTINYNDCRDYESYECTSCPKVNNCECYLVPYDGQKKGNRIYYDPEIHDVVKVSEVSSYVVLKDTIQRVLRCEELRNVFARYINYELSDESESTENEVSVANGPIDKESMISENDKPLSCARENDKENIPPGKRAKHLRK